MIRGFYIGASGMNAQQNRLDAISNNLANVDTTAFKRDVSASKNFSELLLRRMNDDGVHRVPGGSVDEAPIIGKLGLGVETNENFTIFEQGAFKQTSTSTDIALQGAGFVAVQTPQGERYTRCGNFLLGQEGILLTKEGFPVLGENGVLRLESRNINIDSDGNVADGETGEQIDRLKLVRFERERFLQKQGSSLYAATEVSGGAQIAEGSGRPQVLQGYIETSNVNVVNEMVQMIEVNRAYEMNQKAIQSEDAMMGQLWSKVASVR